MLNFDLFDFGEVVDTLMLDTCRSPAPATLSVPALIPIPVHL